MKTGIFIRIIILIMLIMVVSCTVSNASLSNQDQDNENPVKLNPESTPEIKAASALLAEIDRGQVLFGKEPSKSLHVAALSKLMTILIAIESGDLSSSIIISKYSVDAEGSALSLEAGEKYTLEELLYGIMLTSANDAANAVAEHLAGDTEKFAAKMNETAAKLMMKDTHFRNPTGLYDENQYTTAHDILLFVKYAIKNPAFNRIFGSQARPWNHQNGETTLLTSQNKLFWSYDGADGGKTGYNNKDQQALIATASRGNMRLVCIILDSPEKDLFDNAAMLFDYGFGEYRKSILVRKNEILKTVESEGNDINLITTEDVYYVHPAGESYIQKYSTKADLQLPVMKSKVAGTVSYILADGTIIDINLYPSEEIVPPDNFFISAKKKIMENTDILYLVIFLLGIEVILIFTNIFKSIKKLSRKNKGG